MKERTDVTLRRNLLITSYFFSLQIVECSSNRCNMPPMMTRSDSRRHLLHESRLRCHERAHASLHEIWCYWVTWCDDSKGLKLFIGQGLGGGVGVWAIEYIFNPTAEHRDFRKISTTQKGWVWLISVFSADDMMEIIWLTAHAGVIGFFCLFVDRLSHLNCAKNALLNASAITSGRPLSSLARLILFYWIIYH